MAKKVMLLILVCGLFGCRGLKNEQHEVFGDYQKKGKDFEYTLNLNKDNTFTLSEKYQDANPKCSGKWKKTSIDQITLECEEVEIPTETLSNDYMSEREHDIQILSQNKIRFKNVILERK